MPHASTTTMTERHQRRTFSGAKPNQVTKVCSSLLVPVMIAVFTIVTTVLQMNLAKQQREQDLRIAQENREKDVRIEDSRRTAEILAQQDQQMNTILAAYLQGMSELMLSKTFTLADPLITTVIRAKTLTTLGQLDGKRKAHLIRFLYEAKMMTTGRSSIDLTDADLSGVDLTNYKMSNVSFMECNMSKAIFRESNLYDVDFINTQLNGASFDESHLLRVYFDKTNLTNASFIHADIYFSRFIDVTLTNADLTKVRAIDTRYFYVAGNNTIFNGMSLMNSIFTIFTVINGSFVNSKLEDVDMNGVTLIKANFTDARSIRSSFHRSKLVGSIFKRFIAPITSFSDADLVATNWLDADVKGIDFSQANLSLASITDEQIRRAWKTFDIILPNGSLGFDTNLLKNGDAEGRNGECGTNSWDVSFMTTDKHSVGWVTLWGQCYFCIQPGAMQALMSQRFRVPDEYNEWIRTSIGIILIIGECVSGIIDICQIVCRVLPTISIQYLIFFNNFSIRQENLPCMYVNSMVIIAYLLSIIHTVSTRILAFM